MNDQVKVLTGEVVSAKRDKTITVKVERRAMHPKYKKYITRSTKFHAHDELNSCSEGDVVSIRQCRPFSKTKSWLLFEVIEKNK